MKKISIFILTLTMIMGLSITSYAADYTSYDYNGLALQKISLPMDNYSYAIIGYDATGDITLYLSNSPFVYRIYQTDSKGRLSCHYWNEIGTQYKKYIHTSNGWSNGTVFNQNTDIISLYDVFWTSHDIYNRDGELITEGDPNFQPAPPLQEIVIQVMEEQMTVTAPEIHGTMRILVVCGVGCLALLVVLKLFGKRSLIFLRK